MHIFPVLWRPRFRPPSLPEKAIPSNGDEAKASSNTTARLRQRLRASCASAAEGAALGLVCDPRRLVNTLPPGAAPFLAASARGLLRPSLRRASAASCPALRSSRRAQCIVSASAVPHGCATCRSRLAANTPGADQRPAPILCRSACPGMRAPAPSARLLVSRSASSACFALLCAVIKRAHADSLQHTRRPPASALRPALR